MTLKFSLSKNHYQLPHLKHDALNPYGGLGGMTGQRSSRLLACARKCSMKHMVRACSTNQPVLRLSMGSLVLITSTSWAPGCPSELLGQGVECGWGAKQGKTESKKREQQKTWPVFLCRRGWYGDWLTVRRQEKEVRILEKKNNREWTCS